MELKIWDYKHFEFVIGNEVYEIKSYSKTYDEYKAKVETLKNKIIDEIKKDKDVFSIRVQPWNYLKLCFPKGTLQSIKDKGYQQEQINDAIRSRFFEVKDILNQRRKQQIQQNNIHPIYKMEM